MRKNGILFFPERSALFSIHKDRNFKSVDPHLHQFWELILFEQGEGEHMINGIIYPFHAGDMALVSPTDIHSLKSKEGTTHNCTKVTFSYSVYHNHLHEFCHFSHSPVVAQLSPEDFLRASQLMDILYGEFQEPHKSGWEILSLNLITSLLVLLQRNLPSQAEQEQGSVSKVRRILLYVQDHFCEPITVQDAAKALNYSAKHFSRLFHKEFGMSFLEYLKQLRLNYAFQLVSYSDLPIIDICYNTGFNSPTYFSTLFKEKYGVSPNQLRKQNQK